MRLKFFHSALLIVCTLCSAEAAQGQAKAPAGVDQFWSELQKLCSKAYSGTLTASGPNDADMAGKPMTMHVRSCTADEIKIPFFVGDDRSRTWVLTRTTGGIRLKHDHRHEDGKPDKITMYGGTTTNTNSPERVVFPADQQPVDILPAAAGNVWWIDLVPGTHFTYNLRRMGTDRHFAVRFDLTKAVAAPLAPWGWPSK